MKVKALRKALKGMDQDADVRVMVTSFDGFYEFHGDFIETDITYVQEDTDGTAILKGFIG